MNSQVKMDRPYSDDVARYTAKILQALGVDLKHPDFHDTPVRVARMYHELFEGIRRDTSGDVKRIFASKFPSTNKSMIVSQDIRAYSLCPHHLLPVTYDISIGYIPNGYVLGLSKFGRVCELLARKPVLQETLTVDIAEVIQKELRADAVIVTMAGQHNCMIVRGIKQQNSIVHTSHILGAFEHAGTRAEFFGLLNLKKELR